MLPKSWLTFSVETLPGSEFARSPQSHGSGMAACSRARSLSSGGVPFPTFCGAVLKSGAHADSPADHTNFVPSKAGPGPIRKSSWQILSLETKKRTSFEVRFVSSSSVNLMVVLQSLFHFRSRHLHCSDYSDFAGTDKSSSDSNYSDWLGSDFPDFVGTDKSNSDLCWGSTGWAYPVGWAAPAGPAALAPPASSAVKVLFHLPDTNLLPSHYFRHSR